MKLTGEMLVELECEINIRKTLCIYTFYISEFFDMIIYYILVPDILIYKKIFRKKSFKC